MNKRPIPVDEAARHQARADLSKSYIVEAAAGTGKTSLLVCRILSLLRSGCATADEIVAITFTERAAAELKSRLQQELSKAAGQVPAEVPRIEEALRGLERMQVSTIHSFCAALLKESPFEAGVDPNFGVADEITSSVISRRVWDEWLATRMDEDDPAISLAVLLGIQPEQVRALAEALRNHRDVIDFLPKPFDTGIEIEGFIKQMELAITSLRSSVTSSCRDLQDRAALAIANLGDCLSRLGAAESVEARALLVAHGLSVPKTKKLGNKAVWSSQQALDGVRQELERLGDAHRMVVSRVRHNAAVELAQVLLKYVEEYEKAKAEAGVLDFEDLLIAACTMLRDNPGVRKHLRSRYKYLLIDEFQDTDPLQAEIAFFISESDQAAAAAWEDARPAPGRIFLVGDPKQSIYRFRRADIEMYSSAKAKFGKGSLLTIHDNFRCAPSIVGVVNTIFADLIKKPEEGAYQPDYVPLSPGRPAETLPEEHGVVLIYPPEDLRPALTLAGTRRTYEFRCLAAFVKDIIEHRKLKVWDKESEHLRPVMLKDIGILLRGHTGLEILEDALRLYDVNYRVIGGKHFYHRPEVEDLIAVLRAIESPYDTVALLAALRSPFFGVSDEDIFLYDSSVGRLNYVDRRPARPPATPVDCSETAEVSPVEDSFDILRHLHSLRNDLSTEALLQRLYSLTDAPVTYLLKPNGEQRVANLFKVADSARALYERGIYTLRGFATWLNERHLEETEESEAMTVETGDDFVRVLTIHKAKGLEFPVVILADLAGGPKSYIERFIVDRTGRQIALYAGKKEKGANIRTVNFEALKEFEDKRSEAEERRLLYVAMTRARDLLVLPAYWATESDLKRCHPGSGVMLGYLVDHIPRPDGIDRKNLPNGMMVYDASELDLEPCEPPPFRVSFAEAAAEVSESVAAQERDWRARRDEVREVCGSGRDLATATELEAPVVTAEGGMGLAFGVLVHRVLEVVAWDKPDMVASVAQSESAAAGIPAEMAGKAAKMVEDALGSPLVARILGSDRYFKEVPFAFKRDGTVVEGKMDVVFQEGDDLIIVDFKTDSVTPSSIKEKAAAYRHQTETYARAVEAAFGRPPKQVILFFLHLGSGLAF